MKGSVDEGKPLPLFVIIIVVVDVVDVVVFGPALRRGMQKPLGL